MTEKLKVGEAIEHFLCARYDEMQDEEECARFHNAKCQKEGKDQEEGVIFPSHKRRSIKRSYVHRGIKMPISVEMSPGLRYIFRTVIKPGG